MSEPSCRGTEAMPMSDGPRIERSVTLRFKGDWGIANLTRICGWLMHEFTARSGPFSRGVIWNGRGFADEAFAVARGEVDVALMTPAAFATMAVHGVGPFVGQKCADLRALGTIGQNDRLVVAVARELGVASFDELRAKKPALRIATGTNDGTHFVGLAAHHLMAAAGIDDATVDSWGGRYLAAELPEPAIDRFRTGEADVLIHEAVMIPPWAQAVRERQAVFLPVEPRVLSSLHNDFGWPAGTLPAGYWPELTEELNTLDFSDFLLMVRADLPDDIAELLTWCLCETREGFERGYLHYPPERSPVTYPLDPARMCQTAIPLHPGAARHYQSAGVL